MNDITITKETISQAYGEFWSAFQHLKGLVDHSQQGWSKIKMAALTMACFSMEAFANHVGQYLFISWDDMERGMSPIGKLKLFIEMLNLELKYGEAPFNTVNELMVWRNKVAHGTTKTWSSMQTATLNDYDEQLGQIESPGWRKFVLCVDMERVDSDCISVMETIYEKAFGNLEWFLTSARHIGTAK